MMTVSKGREGFDQVFNLVGGLGWFQFLLFLCITLQALVSWHHLSYVFLGAVPPHWCSVPELQDSGWSVEKIRNISLPKSRPGSLYDWEPCSYYDLDYSIILKKSNSSFEDAYQLASTEISDIGVNNSTQCYQWDWDLSIYHSTIVTEFNLVCDRRIWVGTIQGSYMAGVLFGSLILGSLSDQYFGRRGSALISTVITIFGGFATAFTKSYGAFVFFRFILAAGVAGSYQNCYVLMLEYTSTSSRAGFGLVGQLSFAIGYMLVALLGYLFRDWADLQLASSVISLVVLSYYWILPESARWLAYRGEDEKAYNLLKTVARFNRKPEPSRNEIFQIFKSCREKQNDGKVNGKVKDDYPCAAANPTGVQNESSEVQNENLPNESEIGTKILESRVKKFLLLSRNTLGNYFKLLKTPELRKRTLLIWTLFIIVDLVYYGVVFDSATLTNDPFLLVFLAGLMEVPAYTLVVPCLTTLGRRPTVVGTFFLTAICSFIVAYTSTEYEVFRVVVSMSGKLFITSCFAVIYLLGAELFPTSTRTTGLASAVIMGRFGSILAPFVVDMMKTFYRDLPNIIFGMLSVAAAIIALFLPETKDLDMYNDISDLEKATEFRNEQQLKRLSAMLNDSTTSNGTTSFTDNFSKSDTNIHGIPIPLESLRKPQENCS